MYWRDKVLDNRSFPTVEADIILENGIRGRAIVPSGLQLANMRPLNCRDGDKSYFFRERSVKAVDHIVMIYQSYLSVWM